MHILHVVGDTRHQTSHRIAGEKGHGQILQVPEERQAQIMHDEVAGFFHDDFLEEIEHEIDHDQQQVGACNHQKTLELGVAQGLALSRGEPPEIFVRKEPAPILPHQQPGVALPEGRQGGVVGGQEQPVGGRRVVRGRRGAGPGDDIAVDGDFGQIGQGQVQHGDQHYKADGGGQHAAIGCDKRQKPTQQSQIPPFVQLPLFEIPQVMLHRGPP